MKWLSDIFGSKKTVQSCLEAADQAADVADYALAEKLYLQALEMAEEKKEHAQVAVCSFKLGQICQAQGKNAVAETHLRRAYQVHEDFEEAEDAAICLIALGKLYREQHRLAEAEQLFHYVLRIYQQEHGDDCQQMVEPSMLLADCCLKQGGFVESENLLRRVLSIQEKQYGAQSLEVAGPLLHLAQCLSRQDRLTEAEEHFLRAFDIYTAASAEKGRETALSLCACCHEYGRVCLKLSKPEQAQKLFRQAAVLAEEFPGYLQEADLVEELEAFSQKG